MLDQNTNDDLSWLAGGGEMGALIRSMDWSKTPLGPLHAWPQSLRTSVSLCLSSTFPILIAWGPHDIQIYNDAYRPICGDLHPQSMGGAFKEVWASAMPVVGDAFARAHQGEGTYIRDQRMFLDRYGYLEEAFMTFSFSPIRDESGEVGGIFHPISEATPAVLNARRSQGLRDLGAAIGDARTVGDIVHDIAAHHPAMALDLPFVLLYQIDADSGQLFLRGGAGLDGPDGHVALAPTVTALDDAVWPFAAAAQARTAQRVAGLRPRFGGVPCGPYEAAPDAALVLPVTVPGQQELFGFVVAGVSAARELDEDYLNFYGLLGAAVNTAVGNVIAYEKEQRRAEELAQIDRAKTAFFSNVSHEFRTPLTLILGPLDDALADADEPLGPHQRKRIDVTHRNALRLLKLVNSLLDFSRIEAGRVQATYEPFDLARLTTDLASVFESAMAKGGLAYHVDLHDLGQPVYVDRDMWEKIVFNLLSNAFKFTLKGGVTVTLRRLDGMARLSVIDSGSGIPVAELPRVFERFHRIEGTPGRTYEGTGIGLALIQELVRLHGGSIAVHSVVGQGTRFDVDIPFGRAHLPEDRIVQLEADGAVQDGEGGRMGAAFVEEALRWLPDEDAPATMPGNPAAAPAPTLLQPAAAPPRILIADDNNDMRAYVKSLLDPYATVIACSDGEAAFEVLLRDPPDLLLSDVMMPRLDGFGLIARIRATDALRHLPVILLSARAGEEAKVEGLQAGANDYLVKPFAANELLARVRHQIGLARERRRQQDALAMRETYFRSLVDSAPVMLWTTDPSGYCNYLSQRWYDFTGRPVEQDQGIGWTENIHPDEQETVRAGFLACNAAQTPYVADFRLRCHDGSYRWVLDTGLPRYDEDGRFAGFVGTVIDVHERALLQQEQARLAHELTEKNRMQSEFLFTLAHELRNPLAPIRTGLELMRVRPTAANADKVQAMIRRQVDHMVHLVDDLLDMARLSEGKVELRRVPVTLDEVVHGAVEISMPLVTAGAHQLALRLPDTAVALCVDRHRVAQVLSNLLNNAAKYTPRGGSIAVEAALEGDEVAISVIDNGIGIGADVLPRVFDMYVQAHDGQSMAQGGLGVGLNLVKRLVELHGGRVGAASGGTGQGSRFTVWLPLAQGAGPRPAVVSPGEAPADSAAQPAAPGGADILRVLVVDDNVDAAQTLGALLEMSGYGVTLAHDGAAAEAAARAQPPHVVFLDIGLPDRSGFEVAQALRALAGMQEATLVALTGWGAEQDRKRSSEAGFDAHLTKPADFDSVERLLREAAASRGL
jgi:PAS domain S-box-containing protein